MSFSARVRAVAGRSVAVGVVGLLAAGLWSFGGATAAGAATASAQPHLITLALGPVNLVLLPPDPCSTAATQARACIDVIPGVLQVRTVAAPSPITGGALRHAGTQPVSPIVIPIPYPGLPNPNSAAPPGYADLVLFPQFLCAQLGAGSGLDCIDVVPGVVQLDLYSGL